MLEYTKTVLKKVSFDKGLFTKELNKSIKWLEDKDIIQLKQWVIENFYHSHSDIINSVFYEYELKAV